MRAASIARINTNPTGCRPLLKWAGGKTQLLTQIVERMPAGYGRFIEPFFGGGALFFALAPRDAVVADSNPELINLYKSVSDDVARVILCLEQHRNTETHFYKTREIDWRQLSRWEAAARTLYLNKTCFNGLYRVNKAGHFNVPFGRYKNPKIVDEVNLEAAAAILRSAKIICADYKTVLREEAGPGDFVFLDPPYLPVSAYSDFKRYTKEQFRERDHVELAAEVERLHALGCFAILTNSNHPLVDQHYGKFSRKVISTKRHISCNGAGRVGEDVIVTIPPRPSLTLVRSVSPQVSKFPPTRFMGSKSKLLKEIWDVASHFQFDTVIDLFSGSGAVGYMFKAQGKAVVSNDYMAMSATFARAMIENSAVLLSPSEVDDLLEGGRSSDRFVQRTFKGLYFSDADNRFIDKVRANIKRVENPYSRAIAMSALVRACMKKRPRGIFTYTGDRYDDGRRDLVLPFKEQFCEAVKAINAAVFDNGKQNRAQNEDALAVDALEGALVYIDPPYYSRFSDNEYVRRYHFVEGLARDWKGVTIQEHTSTKKFKSYPTPFASRIGAAQAFDTLFARFKNSVVLVSYSSNCEPKLDEMRRILGAYKKTVEVVPIDYTYSFGNQGHRKGNNMNRVQEFLFVGY